MGFDGIAAILLTLLGGSMDMLDMISTQAYWDAKGTRPADAAMIQELGADAPVDIADIIPKLGSSNFNERESAKRKILAQGPRALPQLKKAAEDPDPEIANSARALMGKIDLTSKANQVRRLMTIRTLGESKTAAALPALKTLLESKEIFVAEYARRAIASIEGKEYAPPLPSRDDKDSDLAVLPENCAVVGQMALGGSKPRSIEQMLVDVPMIPEDKRKEIARDVYAKIIEVADQIGNVRADSITLGVSDDVGNDTGSVVLVARGQYDAAAVAAFLRKMEVKTQNIDGTNVFQPERDFGFMFVSNQRAVMVGGPKGDKLPLKDVLTAAANPANKTLRAKPVAALVNAIDRSAALWVAANLKSYKDLPEDFKAFDTITLTGREDKTGISFEARATGLDPKTIKQAIDKMNTELAKSSKDMDQVLQMMPAMKPLVDFAKTIKLESSGNSATATARLEGKAGSLMMFPMMMFSAGRAAPPVEVAPPVRGEAQPDKK